MQLTLNQRLDAKLKKHILLNVFQICYFFALFQLFSTKNVENDYFDQHLGCAAFKPWSEYITVECNLAGVSLRGEKFYEMDPIWGYKKHKKIIIILLST